MLAVSAFVGTSRGIVRKALLGGLALLLFGCDHATKTAAKEALAARPPVQVVEIGYVENRDVAFSVFRQLGLEASRGALLALAGVALAAIAVVWWRMRREASLVLHAGFAGVAAGALGNFVDRAVRGYVVDFVHVRGWPVFNVADAAVVLGAVAIALAARRRNTGRPEARGTAPG